jgi:hypothetical protein
MENINFMEFRRFLWCHEEHIKSNRDSLLSVNSKVQQNAHYCITQQENIMTLLLQQNKRMDILEVKCNML